MKQIVNNTKKEMPPTDGLVTELHLISLLSFELLKPSFAERFNNHLLKTNEIIAANSIIGQ